MKRKFTLLLLLVFSFYSIKSMGQNYYNQKSTFLNANSKWIFGDRGVNVNLYNPHAFNVSYFGIDTTLYNQYYGDISFRFSPWFRDDAYENAYPSRVPHFGWNNKNNTFNNPFCIPVADPATAELRFIVKNHNCYDAHYNLMAHGYGATDNWQQYDSVKGWEYLQDPKSCVVPFVNDPDKYFYFSAPLMEPYMDEYPLLRYTIVDMNLNSGMGDVDEHQKNVTFWHNGADTEQIRNIISVPGNNCDIWLIAFTQYYDAHTSYHLQAYVFNINQNGLNTIPQMFPLDANILTYKPFYLKIAPDRKHILACGYGMDLYDFDAETGAIAQKPHHFNIPEGVIDGVQNAEFSPNGKYLVLSGMGYDEKYDWRDLIYTLKSNPDEPDLNLTFHKNEVILNNATGVSSVSFKPYGEMVYFNVPSNNSNGVSSNNPYHGRHIDSLFANTSICKLIHIPDDSLEHLEYGMSTQIAPFCKGAFPPDIVFPYTSADTIQNVVMDTLVCTPEDPKMIPMELKAKAGFSQYVWNDGSKGNIKTIDEAGKYWVTYQASCNRRVDTFIIRSRLVPRVLPYDTMVCDQRFPFDLTSGKADYYLWFDNSYKPDISIQAPGTYWLKYMVNNCLLLDSIHITHSDCPCFATMPNAFSPNGDGLNDYFKPMVSPGCLSYGYSLFIFNRWGQKIFDSFSEYDKGWNGIIKNEPAQSDTYFYLLRFRSPFLNTDYVKKGEFILIR